MKLQTRFSLSLSVIALIGLLTFSYIIQRDIEELRSIEIKSQLASHLSVSRSYVDDILVNINSDLDLISNDSLTRQFFAADDSGRYQRFHSEITRTLKRYKKHSNLYSEIAIVLPDGYKEIYVNEPTMPEQEYDDFIFSILIDYSISDGQTLFAKETLTGDKHYLVAYYPIKRISTLVKSSDNPTLSYIKISIPFTRILNQISSINIATSFTFINSSGSTVISLPSSYGTEESVIGDGYMTQSEAINDQLMLNATLSLDAITSRTRDLFQQSFALISTAIISLLLTTFFLLRFVIIRPLVQFTELMQDSNVDRYKQKRLTAYESNEFGKLKQRFDELMSRVHNSSADLRRQAFTDTLTGLPNRAALYRLLEKETMLGKRQLSVLFIDLDGFKQVNDIYGHEMGDDLLIEVARRLSTIVRGADAKKMDSIDIRSDVVMRLGGDEFTIVLMSSGHAEVVADRIIGSFQAGIQIGGKTLYTGTSIGISEYPADAETPSLLLQYADMAMYQAKSSGKMRYFRFTQKLALQEQKRQRIEETVREGIEHNRFTAYFQPKIDSRTGKLVSFEALARLFDSDHEMVSPAQFIPVAQKNGVLEYITYVVTEETCKLLKRLDDPKLVASINISPNQLNDLRLIADIRKIMWRYRIIPTQIEFEITEEDFIQSYDAIHSNYDLIRRFGFRTAIDDFGSGYSSLGQLKKLEFDTLKLDRIFVSTEDYNSDAAIGVLRSIKSLADQLNMEVVAEGIETKNQLEFVESFDINIIQGFYYSKPLFADAFEAFYKKFKS